VVLGCVACFALLAIAPVPGAQRSPSPPATVERTVSIPVTSLTGAVHPNEFLVADGTLRALAPARTPAASVCSPVWFTMVALTWHQDGSGDVGAEIRASGRQAGVVDDQDAQPDPGTPESHPDLHTSDLYWTQGRDSRCMRLSLSMPRGIAVSDLRAQFINTSGSASGPGTGPKDTPPAPTGSSFGGPFAPAAAEAQTTKPAMVTRAQWGAMKPRPNCLGFAPSIKMAYVHHTSGSNSYSPAQSDDIMRGIQYYHQITRGYCDIAYNFLVDKYGTIFVGRFKSTDLHVNVIPASQAGFNTSTFSVSAMGNYQVVRPSAATVSSIERVLAWRLDVAHQPPTGTAWMTSAGGATNKYPDGQTVRLPLISGHRQTGITDCPGNYLWALLPRIRDAVYDLGRPKFFRPRQSDPTISPFVESDVFTAKATDPLQWSVVITDASGTTVRILTASGQSLSASWDGTDQNGLPVAPGSYTATIFGQASDGSSARSASLVVTVSSPAPTPTPTPTPTFTPTPTATASPTATPTPISA
jgi:N-acetylmuramoyl-L-alanine amidase/FlgD Ig-like domain